MKIKISVLFFLILILSGCKGFQGLFHEFSHPSDSELRKTFNERNDSFKTLAAMFLEDSKNKSDSFWIGKEKWTLEQLPESRKQTYSELFSSLGIRSIGRDRNHSNIIRLLVTVDSIDLEGNEIEVHTKGYDYSPDGISAGKITFGETDMWGSGRSEIAESWFIFHEIRSGIPE